MSLFKDQVKITERVHNYYDSQNRILKNQKNYINKKNEFLKFCTICKKVWENCSRVGGDSKSKNKINWYNDFPTYGKPRETCEKCK
jgi:hypothetical protein